MKLGSDTKNAARKRQKNIPLFSQKHSTTTTSGFSMLEIMIAVSALGLVVYVLSSNTRTQLLAEKKINSQSSYLEVEGAIRGILGAEIRRSLESISTPANVKLFSTKYRIGTQFVLEYVDPTSIELPGATENAPTLYTKAIKGCRSFPDANELTLNSANKISRSFCMKMSINTPDPNSADAEINKKSTRLSSLARAKQIFLMINIKTKRAHNLANITFAQFSRANSAANNDNTIAFVKWRLYWKYTSKRKGRNIYRGKGSKFILTP